MSETNDQASPAADESNATDATWSEGSTVRFFMPRPAIRDDYLEQYWGPWLIESLAAQRLADMAIQMDHQPRQRVEVEYAIPRAGIAQIDIRGTMTKRGSSFSSNPGTIELRRQVRAAARDEQIQAIVLQIESPGGTSSGTRELADEVASAASRKQVTAFIDDLGASAAYYVASQANRVYANQSAVVGSIGTMMIVADWSGAAQQDGVQVHVIKAGQFKGTGVMGTRITDQQLEYLQGIVDSTNQEFLSAVQSGRGFADEQLAAVATGKVYVTTEAMALGLIDGVRTYEQVLDELQEDVMSEGKQQTEPRPATLQELQSALPGANSEFLVDQLGQNATLDQARDAWILTQEERIQELQRQAESQQGVEPIGETRCQDATVGDALEEWNALVESFRAKGKTHQQAMILANKKDPGLRQRVVAEANS